MPQRHINWPLNAKLALPPGNLCCSSTLQKVKDYTGKRYKNMIISLDSNIFTL